MRPSSLATGPTEPNPVAALPETTSSHGMRLNFSSSQGYASGSFGPTTAGRMDAYVDLFQKEGGSMIMLAKGNRSKQVTDACKKYGGFYLGSIGGPAAILALNCIKKVEVLEYAELGMEAIWKVEVVDFPAFIVVDDKGNDFYAEWQV
ncbi:Fumarate hydratase class I, aerobic [Lamellibrachia satsuma]|nr:Fumarate hydratase class I, aerobic [Lamellibrachia satsuma]